MSIDRLLARFSIQTKVIVLVIPLMVGMAGLAAINLYTGSMLSERLDGTSASIESLTGFQQAYRGMNKFLLQASQEQRDQVIGDLDAQVTRMQQILTLVGNETEQAAVVKATEITAGLRGEMSSLWELYGRETDIRTTMAATLTAMGESRSRLTTQIATIESKLQSAEFEARLLLRSADRFATAAESVAQIVAAIGKGTTPDEVFAAARELRKEIKNLNRTVPSYIAADRAELRSMLVDNFEGILAALEVEGASESGMIALQGFASGLEPTSSQLQDLSAKTARDATIRFAELDKPITRGLAVIKSARDYLTLSNQVERALIEVLANATDEPAGRLGAEVVGLAENLQHILLIDGGDEVLETITNDTVKQIRALPDQATELVETAAVRSAAFEEASVRIQNAWENVLIFSSSQQAGAATVKDRASGITLSAAAVIGGFGLVAAFLLIAALKGPIRRLVSAMRDVASGDLDVDVTDSARADEIGEMARALDVFKLNAIDKIRVEGESERAREMAAQARAQSDSEKAEADSQVRFAVRSLGAALRNLSQGDLVSTIDTPFSGELDSLRTDFNESLERVRDAMVHIRENANSISSNSGQLRSAADDLARRTEQQAASLEETAAAVEQISATVRAASSRASDTDRLAGETANDARTSGEVVGRAVDAMSRIEEASGRINQIIGVIDEIAFQTNLLALNAGVEAARAGEAGRGFAVVAQEVRELAGRSATAAREIKELIARSGEEVRSGVSLVGETGKAITRIIARIEEISDHVGAMATASREQATGLGEVNQAVNQMDQMTQQNAAMVEETNAASHTLAQEAAELTALVAKFRLDAGDEWRAGDHSQAA